MQSHYNFEYLSEMQTNFTRLLWTKVLIFCVEFRELSHLTRDLYQAEKKIDISISLKMVKVVILGEHSCHFVSCSVFFSPQLVISQGKWDNSQNLTQKMRT